jgi:hypothetical protein
MKAGVLKMTLITAAKPAMRYTDLSATNGFRFVFRCDRCGDGVQSELYAFNTEGYSPPPSGKARELLWLRQHKEAYARAESEAWYEFNVCPVCGRHVCGECFRIADDGHGDMCHDCAEAKRETPKRSPVFCGMWRKKRRRSLC